jgi:hypothetical protein
MVVEVSCCLLKAMVLPYGFWGAMVMTVYILNQSMSKGAGGRTSYELWTGSTPLVQHLCTFGCMAHVKDTHPHLKKLDDRSKPIIFVGYEAGSMVYQAYDPATKCMRITHDVMFKEDVLWSWDNDKIDNEFIIEYVLVDHPEVVIMRYEALALDPVLGSPAVSLGIASPVATTPAMASVLIGQASLGYMVMHASPLAEVEEDLDTDHNDCVPLRFCTQQNISEAGLALRLM